MADTLAWNAAFRQTVRTLQASGAQVTDEDVDKYCEWHEFLGQRIPGVFRYRFEDLPQAHKDAFCRAAEEYLADHPEFRKTLRRVTEALAGGKKRGRSVCCPN